MHTPHFHLYLFNGFHATRNAEPLTDFRSDKTRVLLAYLVLEASQQPLRRERLLDLLWPDYAPASARASLRTALSDLRRMLAPLDLIQATRQTVQFDAAHPDFWCDALTFAAHLVALDDQSSPARTEHRPPPQAPDPSLSGDFGPRDRSEGLQPGQQSHLQTAVSLYTGDFLAGFDVSDSPSFAGWLAQQRARFRRQKDRAMALLQAAADTPRHNLPRATTPLFGRRREIETVRRRLLDADYPLVTLVGLGGAGKTRIALAAAQLVLDNFAGGIWFVPLAGIAPAPVPAAAGESLATAIANAMRLPLHGGNSTTAQLLRQIGTRATLLVLDSFEHLMASTGFVRQLVETLPHTHVLITSRQRLGYQMEQTVYVRGLAVPPADHEARPKGHGLDHHYSSVQLFVERANRTASGFVLNAENTGTVAAICRAVAGLPLGIELAAAAIAHQPLGQIAGALHHRLDVLATEMPDVAPRHRSLRAVFERSWRLLPPDAAQTLARCAVFHSGFTQAAATAVAGASRTVLKTLVDQSLLQWTPAGRYDFHDLLRQFAAEKLAAQPDTQTETLVRHSRYYLNLAGRHKDAFVRGTTLAAFVEMEMELDNVRQAWRYAVEARQIPLLALGVGGVAALLEGLNLFQEELAAVEHALETLGWTRAPIEEERRQLFGQLKLRQAILLFRTGRYAEGARAAAVCYELRQEETAALALWTQARCMHVQGDIATARALLLQALSHCQSDALLSCRARVLNSLGMMSRLSGELDRAETYGLAAMEAARRGETIFGLATSQWMLAEAYTDRGQYWRAWELANASVALLQPLGLNLQWAFAALALARAEVHLGQFGRARRLAAEVLELARRTHAAEVHAIALSVLAQAHDGLEEYAMIRQLGEEGEALRRERGPSLGLTTLQLYTGHAHAALGQIPQAQAAYENVLFAHRRQGMADIGSLDALAGLARLALRRGDGETARRYTEQMLDIPPRIKAGHAFVCDLTNVYFTCYRVLRYTGDPRAPQLLAQTVRSLRDRAERIPDLDLRRRFLENVPLHREILQMAQAQPAYHPLIANGATQTDQV